MSASSESKKKSSKSDEIPIEEVHTANDWEHADLGDEQRKQKFLRLMGAKKRKDDHSKSHEEEQLPEKKHSRSKVENETINRELEKQFNEGLHSKIAHVRHGGLGFQTSGNSSASSSTDWRDHSAKATFVPASSPVEKLEVKQMASTDIDQAEEKKDESEEKKEKKEKKKKKKERKDE